MLQTIIDSYQTSMKQLEFEVISTSSDQSVSEHTLQHLVCAACEESYDLNDQLPLVICENQHILCRRCAFKLYVQHARNHQIMCRFCQTLLQWPHFPTNLMPLLRRKAISEQNQQILSLCDFSIQQAIRTILIEDEDVQQGHVEVEEEVLDWPCFIGQPLRANKLHLFEITSTIDEIAHISLGFTTDSDLIVLSFEDKAIVSQQGICYTHFDSQPIQQIISQVLMKQSSQSSRVTIEMKMDVPQQQITWFVQSQPIFSLPLLEPETATRPYFEYKHRLLPPAQ